MHTFFSCIKIHAVKFTLLGAVCLISGLLLYSIAVPNDEVWKVQAEHCSTDFIQESEMINCWMKNIESTLIRDGTEEAFEVFEYVYAAYDVFANSGCHRQAHRIGDFAYYSDYLSHTNLDQVAFPKNANACGYGFYHGFIEHLIQNDPRVDFAKEFCSYLIDRQKGSAPDIDQICYHGSGHGFLIAQADEIYTSGHMNIVSATKEPLQKCDSLGVGAQYIGECREGVFNVFVDWMIEGNYGLAYDKIHPFVPCEPLLPDEAAYKDCSVEVSRKFDSLSGFMPARALELVQENPYEEIHSKMFQIAVAGIIQQGPKTQPFELVAACRALTADFKELCFSAIISGLFEHGVPGTAYKTANSFCGNEFLSQEEEELCFSAAKSKLLRFYTKTEILELCAANALSGGMCRS